ncbi:MAG: acetyltransferase, partial [Acidobacteria bacterium]|nr:acetyltransferase [Acidobacteriota bacterium]
FEVSVPMRELAGSENLLTIVFRVRPEGKPEADRYFIQRVKVPELDEEAKGEAFLQGGFDIGEGKYQVEWLMRDRAERVCSHVWKVEASLPAKDKQMEMNEPADTVEPSQFEQFHEEPPVSRNPNETQLNVKVLINFAPQRTRSATLQPVDTSALVSILRTISRDPRIGKFSLVAFNMQDQKILYKQENADRIDFPKIGEALRELKLGTVDLKKLAVKNSETEFLSELLQKELGGSEVPDALIFAGPKVLLEQNVPQETLRSVGAVDYPVFYLNYNLYPQQIPWRDSIGHAVKHFRGVEYTISRPRDLWFAVSEMVQKIGKARQAKRAGVAVIQ